MSKKLLVLTSIIIALTASFANAQNNTATTTNQNFQAIKPENKSKSEFSAEKKQKHELKEKIQSNPACKNILDTCQKMGFVAGGFKEGNGLWRNCFHPVIAGKAVTQRGNPVTVNVNASDVAACKAAVPQEKFEGRQNPENKAMNSAMEKLGNVDSQVSNKEKSERRKIRNAKENLVAPTSNQNTTNQQ